MPRRTEVRPLIMLRDAPRRRLIVLTAAVACFAALAAATWDHRARQTGMDAELAPIAQSERLVREHAPVIGPPDAAITIVEFFDPSCEACRRFHPILKDVLANTDDVRLVVRYFVGHGSASTAGVRVLEAARRQGLFAEVSAALLERQTSWAGANVQNERRALAIAGDVGLDVNQARSHLDERDISPILEQDRNDAIAIGVRGTPTIFVNGKLLPSLDAATLEAMTQSERHAAK